MDKEPEMKKVMRSALALLVGVGAAATAASATDIVITYEDLTEGFYGTSFTHQGVTYRDINQVSGHFPSGETFGPQPNEQVIIENATFAYDDFPEFGSPIHALTFGIAYIAGDNLSIGRVSSVTMDLPGLMEFASVELLYYENGPWGGISYHLDAKLDGVVVASDSFVISDLGGRDNPAMGMLSVSAAAFDELHLYAWYNGQYSLPRALLDDLTLRPVAGGGGCAADFDGSGTVNSGDITAFIAAWLLDIANGTLVADFDGSGAVNSGDITAFLTAWLAEVGQEC